MKSSVWKKCSTVSSERAPQPHDGLGFIVLGSSSASRSLRSDWLRPRWRSPRPALSAQDGEGGREGSCKCGREIIITQGPKKWSLAPSFLSWSRCSPSTCLQKHRQLLRPARDCFSRRRPQTARRRRATTPWESQLCSPQRPSRLTRRPRAPCPSTTPRASWATR